MRDYIEAAVLSCSEDLFRAKVPSETDTLMYRLYVADHKGRVGYLYSRQKYEPGAVVRLGLAERDGRVRLCVLS